MLCRGTFSEQAKGDGTEADYAEIMEVLRMLDVLVDGEFVEGQKNLSLAFRGSENQRLIDVQASLRQGETICLPPD